MRRFQHPELSDSKRILYFVLRTGAQKQHRSRSISQILYYETTRLVKTSRFLLQMNRTVEQDVVAFDIVSSSMTINTFFSTVMLKGLQFNLIVCNDHN